MEQNNETSLVKDYFGFDTKTVLTFLGLVTLVIVVVTFIYVSIFGFDNWKTSMSQAGSMMLANFDPQAATPLDNRGELVTPAVPNATPAAGAGIQQPGGGSVQLPRLRRGGPSRVERPGLTDLSDLRRRDVPYERLVRGKDERASQNNPIARGHRR